VNSARDQAGIVSHVDHEQRADFFGDLGELAVVDFARVSAGSGDDEFRFVLTSQRGDVVEVDLMVVFADSVRHGVVDFAGEVDLRSVSQMPAVVETHRQVSVARIQYGQVDRHVGLRAGVRLDVGVVGTEQFAGSVTSDGLDDVDILAAAVVSLFRVTFSVFIGQAGAGCFHDGGAGVIFRRNQLQALFLTDFFGLNGGPDIGISLLKIAHDFTVFWR